MATAKELERKTNRQLAKLHNEEGHIAQLQAELSRNPKFVEFLEAQKKLQKKTDDFWNSVKQQMIDAGVTQVDIDTDFVAGKLTISYTKGYEAKDLTKLNEKYVTLALNTDAVKKAVEATGTIPKGVDEKGFYRLNKTLKTKDIVS